MCAAMRVSLTQSTPLPPRRGNRDIRARMPPAAAAAGGVVYRVRDSLYTRRPRIPAGWRMLLGTPPPGCLGIKELVCCISSPTDEAATPHCTLYMWGVTEINRI